MRRAAILLLLAAAALGGDLRDALDAARQQDPKAAADGISKALDAGASRDEAAEAIAPSHWPLLAALAARPEGAAVVKRLLVTAYGPVAEPPAAAIPQADQIAKAAVLEPAYATRFEAATQLERCYGERAVPCLLPYLRSDDIDAMTNAHLSLLRLGRTAALPLAVAVRTDDANMRRFVARQLAGIGDPRTLPVLLELAEKDGADSPVGRAAAKVRARHAAWAGDGTAKSAHLALGRRYGEGDPAVARLPPGQPPLVWCLAGDQLVARLPERHLYFIELAKRSAQDALRLDPKDRQARELLDRLDESEKLAGKLVAESRR